MFLLANHCLVKTGTLMTAVQGQASYDSGQRSTDHQQDLHIASDRKLADSSLLTRSDNETYHPGLQWHQHEVQSGAG